jgi:multiple sugar transport system substrate-binding protein
MPRNNHSPGRSVRRVLVAVAGAAVTALIAAGCSAGGGTASTDKVSQSDIDKAMTTPTTLTMWDWVSGVDKQVALFEKKYPKIKVKLENVGNGAPHYAKIRTATKAGSGGADVVQMEYQYINSFTVNDSLLNLAPYGADKLKSDYPEWVWNQVSRDGAVYAIPGDQGPMGNLYREDILAKAGITQPPATWDEFAEDAKLVKERTGSYLVDFAPNNPGQLIGFFWAAGAKPFSYDGGKKVGIDLNSPQAKQVLDFWQKLIDQDLVAVDPDFTDSWFKGLATGQYASWLTAAWGPTFLQGTAKDTSGLWRAAELPQWDASRPNNGNWGGSSFAVLKTSKHPIAAYELARFLNNEKSEQTLASNDLSLYPTLGSVLTDPTFTDAKVPFYGGQTVNKTFSDLSKKVDTDFEWLPYTDYAYTSYNDTLGKAISTKGDLAAGAAEWQKSLVDYGKKQGFTVTGQ